MTAWVVFVLAIALALMLGIERLLARLGVRRADPTSAPGGLRDIVAWVRRHRR